MAFPAGLVPKTVTIGPVTFLDGTPATGAATIQTAVNVLHIPSGQRLMSGRMVHKLDETGCASFQLIPTDAAGLDQTGWTYRLILDVSGAGVQPPPVDFLLPAAGPDSVDLDTLVTVPTSTGSTVAVDVVTADQLAAAVQGLVTEPELATDLAGYTPLDGGHSVVLRSPASRTADTARLRVISYQKQEPENANNGGEGLWLDLADARAKNMLTWRLAFDTVSRLPLPGYRAAGDADLHRIAWAGAHYYAQDQVDYNNPTDVHGHWSVEVPDSTLALRTRFEIKFADAAGKVGLDKALVQTASADLSVDCSNNQVLRLRTGAGAEKRIEFGNDQWGAAPRWFLAQNGTTEAGSDSGSDFEVRRVRDNGSVPPAPLLITRSNGKVTLGGSDGSSGSVQVNRNSAGIALTVNTNLAGATGATAVAITPLDATSRLIQSNVAAETTARFVAFADGKQEWGAGGTTGRDTNLYRDRADVLRTDDALKVGAYATASRPSATTLGVGAQLFDTTLKKPIWSTGTAWVDATGATV